MALSAEQIRAALIAKKRKLLPATVLSEPMADKPAKAVGVTGEARESTETDGPATDHRALERGSGSDSRGGQKLTQKSSTRNTSPENQAVTSVPQAPEIEKAALAIIFQIPDVGFQTFNRIAREGFLSNPVLEALYWSAWTFYSENGQLNLIAFTQKLADLGQLDTFGGAYEITQFFTANIQVEMLAYYLEELREKYVRRRLYAAAKELSQRTTVASITPGTLLQGLRSLTDELESLSAETLEGVEDFSYTDLLNFDSKKDPTNLLGNRWVCKGYTCLWAGASGIGKSSFEMQFAHYWALGQPCFGIAPVRPLKSLILQNENDLGDTGEQLQGVLAGIRAVGDLDLNGSCEQMVIVKRIVGYSGSNFLDTAKELIRKYRPDLLWIDPLHAFAGVDLMSPTATGHFLREGLIPLAINEGIGVHVLHHAGKSAQDSKSKSHWTEIDYQYLGFGTSEIQNAFRAINVLIPVANMEKTYRLILSKRGERAGAKDLDGHKCSSLYIAHSKTGILWQQVEPPDKQEQRTHKVKYSATDILDEMSSDQWFPVDLLKHMKENAGMSDRTFYYFWKQLKNDALIRINQDGKWSRK